MRKIAVLLLLAGIAPSSACGGKRATIEDCARILDKIVELELREKGFRDPALLERKRAEFRRRFAGALKQCEGKRLRHGAAVCIEGARGAEEISHRCLSTRTSTRR